MFTTVFLSPWPALLSSPSPPAGPVYSCLWQDNLTAFPLRQISPDSRLSAFFFCIADLYKISQKLKMKDLSNTFLSKKGKKTFKLFNVLGYHSWGPDGSIDNNHAICIFIFLNCACNFFAGRRGIVSFNHFFKFG